MRKIIAVAALALLAGATLPGAAVAAPVHGAGLTASHDALVTVKSKGGHHGGAHKGGRSGGHHGGHGGGHRGGRSK